MISAKEAKVLSLEAQNNRKYIREVYRLIEKACSEGKRSIVVSLNLVTDREAFELASKGYRLEFEETGNFVMIYW